MMPPPNADGISDREQVAGDCPGSVQRWRVVLVDDSRPERELLRVWLEESCHFLVVGEAADGNGGVELAAELRPELVVLDLSMPAGDGVQALTRVLSVSPLSAVVVFSGFLSADLARALCRQGASACLDKNAGPARLIEELLRVLEVPEMQKT
jgi:DNA-binding NarL/FixJ family response regulator